MICYWIPSSAGITVGTYPTIFFALIIRAKISRNFQGRSEGGLIWSYVATAL